MAKPKAAKKPTEDNTPAGVCSGRAAWWINVLCCPFVLMYHAVDVYLLGCVYAYAGRIASHTYCFLCLHAGACRSCYEFVDKDFPPNERSLGPSQRASEVVWKRASEMVETSKGGHALLFNDGIEPADVAQGALGDCWLISALACIAEHPGAVSNNFRTREYSSRGKYCLRLFNGLTKKWEKIVVDDRFPCNRDGSARFAQQVVSPAPLRAPKRSN